MLTTPTSVVCSRSRLDRILAAREKRGISGLTNNEIFVIIAHRDHTLLVLEPGTPAAKHYGPDFQITAGNPAAIRVTTGCTFHVIGGAFAEPMLRAQSHGFASDFVLKELVRGRYLSSAFSLIAKKADVSAAVFRRSAMEFANFANNTPVAKKPTPTAVSMQATVVLDSHSPRPKRVVRLEDGDSKRLFTVTCREWHDCRQRVHKDYQVWATSARDARQRFGVWVRAQKKADCRVVGVAQLM